MADKKVTKEIYELEVQFNDRESRKRIRELANTMEELTKQQIDGGKESAKLTKEILESLKLQELAYGKNSKRFKNQQKLAMDAMRKQAAGDKNALRNRVKNIQSTEREMRSIFKALHAADELGQALAEQSRIKAQSIEDDKEREKFLEKEAELIHQIVTTRKQEAMTLKKKAQVLSEITAETAAVRENTKGIAKETRGARYLNMGARGASALGNSILSASDSLGRGYSRQGLMGVVGNIKGMGSSASSSLSKKAEEYKTKAIASATSGTPAGQILKSASSLASVFSKLATVVGVATKFLGAFASIIMVAIEADAKSKEMNKKLSSKMGSATMMGGNMLQLSSSIVDTALGNNAMRGGLRLNTEELTEGSSALMQSGVNIKNLTGGFKSFENILDTTAVASRNFGLEMSEAAGMVGDYFNSFGVGAETIKDTFAALNQDIKASSMTTNQFLATINSVSAQFNIFLDQTREFSQLLSQMSKGGGLSTKQINKFMQTLAGFGPRTVDEGIRTMALFGPEIQKNARRDMADVEKRLRSNQYGSEAERGNDLRKLENLRVVARGGINSGTALKDAMGPMGIIQSVLGKKGIQTFDQMRDAKNNLQLVKVLSASTGKSDEEVQDMLEAASSLMENSKQTFSELMAKNREELMKAADAKTARREAEEYASQTVTKMSGLQDIGNALLLKISEIMTRIYNLFDKSKMFGSGGKNQIGEVSVTDAKGALTKQLEDLKKNTQGALQGGTPQDSALNKNMTRRLMGANVSLPIRSDAFPAGPSSPSGAAATKIPDGTSAAGMAGAGGKEAPVHMEAVLVLPNNRPIELIVHEVLYKKGSRQ